MISMFICRSCQANVQISCFHKNLMSSFESLDPADCSRVSVVSYAGNHTTSVRTMLDIELHCADGLVLASSQTLGQNSRVFEKMLFARVQMSESITSQIRLDDVRIQSMELLLKFCRFHRNYPSLLSGMSIEAIMLAISIAHRFEFVNAQEIMCDRLVELVPEPSPVQLQFADRFDLHSVLRQWARLCESAPFQHKFTANLAAYPLSKESLKIFADAHFKAHMRPKFDSSQCSPKITIHGSTCRACPDMPVVGWDFVYLTSPPLDSSGCYSMSLICGGDCIMAGFGINDALSRDMNRACPSIAAYFISGFVHTNGRGVSDHEDRMDRPIGDDTLTLTYNPHEGTLHGAYNLEPAILLRKAIPPGERAPLQPFIGIGAANEFVTVVVNPQCIDEQ